MYHPLPMQILSCHPTAKARRLLRLLFLRICEVSERSRFKLTHYPAHARTRFLSTINANNARIVATKTAAECVLRQKLS